MLDKQLCLRAIPEVKPGEHAYIERHVDESNASHNPFEMHRLALSTTAIEKFPGQVEPLTEGKPRTLTVSIDASQALAMGKVADTITEDEFNRIQTEIVKAITPYAIIKTNQLVSRLEVVQVQNFHATNRIVATIQFRGA